MYRIVMAPCVVHCGRRIHYGIDRTGWRSREAASVCSSCHCIRVDRLDIVGHFPRRQATAICVASTYLFLEAILAAIDLAGCGRSALELRRFASTADITLVGILCCIGGYHMVVDPGYDDDHRRKWATQSRERAPRGGWSAVDGLGIVPFAFFADALRKPTLD